MLLIHLPMGGLRDGQLSTEHAARVSATEALFDTNYDQKRGSYWWTDDDPLSFNSSDYTSPTVRAFLELVENETIIPSGNAIDVGSAEGRDAARAAKLGYWTTGLELSRKGIQASYDFTNRFLEPAARRRVEYFKRDLLDWPMGKEQYDLVWFRGVIDYLLPEAKTQAIGRLQAATKVGGIFVVHTVIDNPEPIDTPPHQQVPLIPDMHAELTTSSFANHLGWEALRLIYEWHKPHDDPQHSHSHFNGIYRKLAAPESTTPAGTSNELVRVLP
jgi:hypothetical protein